MHIHGVLAIRQMKAYRYPQDDRDRDIHLRLQDQKLSMHIPKSSIYMCIKFKSSRMLLL